jgi:hypothetical protein
MRSGLQTTNHLNPEWLALLKQESQYLLAAIQFFTRIRQLSEDDKGDGTQWHLLKPKSRPVFSKTLMHQESDYGRF